jgi:hypothetical protein
MPRDQGFKARDEPEAAALTVVVAERNECWGQKMPKRRKLINRIIATLGLVAALGAWAVADERMPSRSTAVAVAPGCAQVNLIMSTLVMTMYESSHKASIMSTLDT